MWDSEADTKVPTATVASPKSPALPSNPVYAVFTSGSTGTPKGTVIEHRSFATNALNGPNSQFLDRKSRVFQFASYAFDASFAQILFPFVSGGCVCVPHETDRATDVVGCANSFGITHLYQTPSMVRTLHPSQFTTLKTLILCGEAMKQDDMLTWAHRVQLINAYGPSECTIASVQRLKVTAGSEPSNIGTSCSACSWVVDPENHENLLPIDAVGELVVERPIVGRGYIDEEEKTTAVFVNSPAWLCQIRGQRRVYKTGDLVQYDPIMDGSLLYRGRRDTQVKLRGQRIELGEIEYRILQCSPNIKDVIVELVTAESKSPALVAFIWGNEWVKPSWVKPSAQDESQLLACPSAEFRALVAEMQATLQDQLPAYMIPSGFLPVRRIPRTSTGKADRKRLCKLSVGLSPEDMLQFRGKMSVENRMPVTEAEKILPLFFD
ncbi:uncharacterized protein N7529_007294 [Penicillium soppii]|uniref:uncharacterized protein n=1 Tax=Penicillium soppii TaxID=69789 RepID=UPI0025469BE6|nr:uncharacterized protein N7529_007294 [Penicillium soppii]KAJ5865378.1 hypothetical protein N7529_007294 [Penicillium soppii]